jgi:hypothetical protein
MGKREGSRLGEQAASIPISRARLQILSQMAKAWRVLMV